MFERIRRAFSFGDPLVEVAKSGDGSLFKETFRNSEIFVVSRPVPQSLDPDLMSDEDLRRLMESAAREMAKDGPVEPFTYGPESDRVLPVFSCEAAAEAFVEAYVTAAKRVIPFMIGSLEGEYLLPLLKAPLRLVLNPLTDTEFDLPASLQAELRA